jgi:hypothetical protein
MSDRGLAAPCLERARRLHRKGDRPPLPASTPSCNAFVPRPGGFGSLPNGCELGDDVIRVRSRIADLDAQIRRLRITRDEQLEILASLEARG